MVDLEGGGFRGILWSSLVIFQYHIPNSIEMCKKNFKSEIIQILLSHSPQYGDYQGFAEIQNDDRGS